MNPRKYVCLVGLMFITGGLVVGQARDPETLVRQAFENSALLIRGFPSDSHILLDESGRPLHPLHTGPWTLAFLEIHKVKVKDRQIQMEGNRVGLMYDTKSKAFNKVKLSEKISMTIVLPALSLDLEAIKELRRKVFIEGSLEADVPEFWQNFVRGKVKTATTDGKVKHFLLGEDETESDTVAVILRQGEDGEPIYNPKGEVIPPRPVSMPEPEYSESARKLGFAGTTVLRVVVAKNGRVRETHIIQPTGLGLDEQAVNAVKTWRFKPASYRGSPVEAEIDVAVSFELYH